MNFLLISKKLLFLCNIFVLFGLKAEGFLAGSLVKTNNGQIAIEKIEVGDEIFCFDVCKNQFVIEKVSHKKSMLIDEKIKISFFHNNKNNVLFVSPKQKFLVPLRINNSKKHWVLAKNLKVGEYLLRYVDKNCTEKKFSFIKIKNIELIKLNNKEEVTLLSIKNNKNYCISEAEILVHNFVPELSMVEFGLLEASAAAELAALDLVAFGSAASGFVLPAAGIVLSGFVAKKLYDHYSNRFNQEELNEERIAENQSLDQSLPGADVGIIESSLNLVDFSKTEERSRVELSAQPKEIIIQLKEEKGSFVKNDFIDTSWVRDNRPMFLGYFMQLVRQDQQRQYKSYCLKKILQQCIEPQKIENYLYVRDHSLFDLRGENGCPRLLLIDYKTKRFQEVAVNTYSDGLMTGFVRMPESKEVIAFKTQESMDVKNAGFFVYLQGGCRYLDPAQVYYPTWAFYDNKGTFVYALYSDSTYELKQRASQVPAIIFLRMNEVWINKDDSTITYDYVNGQFELIHKDKNGFLLARYDVDGKCLYSKELEEQTEKAMAAIKLAEEAVVEEEREYEKVIENYETAVKNLIQEIKIKKEEAPLSQENNDQEEEGEIENESVQSSSSATGGGGGKKPEYDEEDDEDKEEEEEDFNSEDKSKEPECDLSLTCEEKHPGEQCDDKIDCGRRKLLHECEEERKNENLFVDEIKHNDYKDKKDHYVAQNYKKLENLLKKHDTVLKKVNNNEDRSNSVSSQNILQYKVDIIKKLPSNPDYIRSATTLDGKIRFFKEVVPCSTPGRTRGAAYVAEYDTKTGKFRSWMESYDHQGNVIRINEKNVNGLDINGPHTPPTGNDYQNFNIKPSKG